jgi:hypothetical protein
MVTVYGVRNETPAKSWVNVHFTTIPVATGGDAGIALTLTSVLAHMIAKRETTRKTNIVSRARTVKEVWPARVCSMLIYMPGRKLAGTEYC